MKNNKSYTVISVESRKGGVGKTTIALNLAHRLREKYKVLFFDLDISGTEASRFVGSLKEHSFWTNFLHTVDDPKSNPKVPLNLVDQYEAYMTGKDVPNVSWGKEEQDKIRLETEKVNIFSSYLKRDSGNDKKDKRPRYSPEVLFDEMHAQWFMEMIKDIAERAAAPNDEKKLVIIIDNAPGYSGLEPEVEKWLLTLGPECGKFLFVGSLDTQDIESCVDSICDIHELFKKRWDTSRLVLNKDITEIPKGTDMEFFNYLIESAPLPYPENDGKSDKRKCAYPAPRDNSSCNHCGLCFYRHNDDKIAKPYCDNPARYTALITNKTPELVTDDRYDYIFPPGIAMKAASVGIHQPWKELVIPYMPALSVQFMADRLKDIRAKNPNLLSLEQFGEIHDKLQDIKNKFHPSYETIEFSIRTIQNQLQLLHDAVRIISGISPAKWGLPIDTVHTIAYAAAFAAVYCAEMIVGNAIPVAKDIAVKIALDIDRERAIAIAGEIAIDRAVKIARDRAITIDKDIAIARAIAKDVASTIAIDRALAKDLAKDITRDRARDIARDRDNTVVVLLMLHEVSNIHFSQLDDIAFWKEQVRDKEKVLVAAMKFDIAVSKSLSKTLSADTIAEIYITYCKTKIRFLDAKRDYDFLIDCCITVAANRGRMKETELGLLAELARQVVIDKTMTHEEGLAHLKGMGYANIIGEANVGWPTDYYADYRNSYITMTAIYIPLDFILSRDQWNLI